MNENTRPYRAIIKGKRCKIAWDENYDNVLLVDGVPYEVGLMEGSLDVLREQRLLSVSELKFCGSTGRAPKGWWLVDGKHPGEWIMEASGDSRRFTYHYLDQVLSKNERPAKFTKNRPAAPAVEELRRSAVAVAFVKEHRHPFDDGKSMLLPIFLSRFKPTKHVPYPAEMKCEKATAERSKAKKARQPKPIVRFENDFAQVVIPQKKQEAHTEGVPGQLRVMVRVIVQGGGRLAGPELKSQMQKALGQKTAANIRPDKLLLSKVGITLEKAKLIGSKRGKGAITMYWAKQKAG